MAKRSMTVRLDPTQEARVTEYANAAGVSKSEAVAHFLALGIEAADHGRPATVADLRDALSPVAAALGDLRGALPEAAEPSEPEPPEVEGEEAPGDLGPDYWVGVGRAQVRRELAGDGAVRLSAALAVACAALAVLLALAMAGVIG